MIAKLKRVPPRTVWQHEPAFTKWLEQNLDVLNEVVNLNLGTPQREKAAGGFSVDLVAEDVNGSVVVIENQLDRSDHDHLSKLVTYLADAQTQAAICIFADPAGSRSLGNVSTADGRPASGRTLPVAATGTRIDGQPSETR